MESTLGIIDALIDDTSPLRRLLEGSGELQFMHKVRPRRLVALESAFDTDVAACEREIDKLVVASKIWNLLNDMYPHASTTLSRIKVAYDDEITSALERREGSGEFEEQDLETLGKSGTGEGYKERVTVVPPLKRETSAKKFLQRRRKLVQSGTNETHLKDLKKGCGVTSTILGPSRSAGQKQVAQRKLGVVSATPKILLRCEAYTQIERCIAVIQQSLDEVVEKTTPTCKGLGSEQGFKAATAERGAVTGPGGLKPSLLNLQRAMYLLLNSVRCWSKAWEGVIQHCWWVVVAMYRSLMRHHLQNAQTTEKATSSIMKESSVLSARIDKLNRRKNHRMAKRAELSMLHPQLSLQLAQRTAQVSALRASIANLDNTIDELYDDWQRLLEVQRNLTKCQIGNTGKGHSQQHDNGQDEQEKNHQKGEPRQEADRIADDLSEPEQYTSQERDQHQDYKENEAVGSRIEPKIIEADGGSKIAYPSTGRAIEAPKGGQLQRTLRDAKPKIDFHVVDPVDKPSFALQEDVQDGREKLHDALNALKSVSDTTAKIAAFNKGRNPFLGPTLLDACTYVQHESMLSVSVSDPAQRWEDTTSRVVHELHIPLWEESSCQTTKGVKATPKHRTDRFNDMIELRRTNELWRLATNNNARNADLPTSFAHLAQKVTSRYHSRPMSLADTRGFVHAILVDFASCLLACSKPLWLFGDRIASAKLVEHVTSVQHRFASKRPTTDVPGFVPFVHAFFDLRTDADLAQKQLLDFLMGAALHRKECALVEYFCTLAKLVGKRNDSAVENPSTLAEHEYLLATYLVVVLEHDPDIVIHQQTGQLYCSMYALFGVLEQLISFCLPETTKTLMESVKATSFRVEVVDEYSNVEAGAQIGPLFTTLITILRVWKSDLYDNSQDVIDALFNARDYTNRGALSAQAATGLLASLGTDTRLIQLAPHPISKRAFHQLVLTHQLITPVSWKQQGDQQTLVSMAHRDGVKDLPLKAFNGSVPSKVEQDTIQAYLYPRDDSQTTSSTLQGLSSLRLSFSHFQHICSQTDTATPQAWIPLRVAMWLLQWEIHEAMKQESADKNLRSLKYMLKWKALCKLFRRKHIAESRNTNASRLHPIFSACRWGKTEVVCRMLNGGVPSTLADERGNTLLHYAVQNNHTDLVQALLLADANPLAMNDHGQSCTDLAKRFGYRQCVFILSRVVGKTIPRNRNISPTTPQT